MPTWSEAQKKAIYTKQKNILVSASAGAGKTTVLIARLVDLVMQDRIGIDRILAMTFTEAAANEMKLRLAKELNQLYETTSKEADKIYIKEQLSAIPNAHISTIHSFCLSILQKYYYIINKSAKAVNTILDDGKAYLLKEEAMEEVFAYQNRQNQPQWNRLCAMFSARVENNEQLKEAIVGLSTIANAQKNPQEWLDSCVSIYQNVTCIEDIEPSIQALFFHKIKMDCEAYENLILRLCDYTNLQYEDQVKKIAQLQKKKEGCQLIWESFTKQNYYDIVQSIQQVAHLALPSTPNSEDLVFTRLRKQIQTIETTMLSYLFEESFFVKQIQELAPSIELMVSMCKMYRQKFDEKKQALECIDFDDMEHGALSILKANNYEIAKEYQVLFEEIMVDEFQDSNEVQNELVQLICRKNNVFRVGDIKQSIYGFRYAKPQLMRSLIANAQEYDEVIYLSNNYRSKKMIVDFNNDLFSEVMNLSGFDCTYTKDDATQTGIAAQEEDNVLIHFHCLYAKDINATLLNPLSSNELKASYIANQIIAIKEKENKNWRDFVVLVRSNARLQDMKQIFDTLKIPYFIEIKSGFYDSSAIQTILSILQALCNPWDEIAFIACMSSHLFQISWEEFAQIKLDKSKWEKQQGKQISYYEYMKLYKQEQLYSFEALRALIYQQSICETLQQLFQYQDYYMSFTNAQEKTNLDLLYEKADQFEQQQGTGIDAFMKEMQACKQIQSGEAIPIGSEDDVVKVMSIHQSKGLQFPVVFLWSNSKLTVKENSDLMLYDDTLKIACKHMDVENRYTSTTLMRIAMEHKKAKEMLEEEMRILYVATTRAQQQMHIVDVIKDETMYSYPLSEQAMYEFKGYTSWILQSKVKNDMEKFKLVKVQSMWENKTFSKEEQKYTNTKYGGFKTTFEVMSASMQKQKEAIAVIPWHQQDAMKKGTQIHKVVEHLNVLPWDENLLKHYQQHCDDTIVKALDGLQHSYFYQKLSKEYEVYFEYPFLCRDQQQILSGTIDLIAFGKDIIIVDFKSDKISETQLLDNYKMQLDFYKKAIQIAYPDLIISCYIYSFHLGKEIQVP